MTSLASLMNSSPFGHFLCCRLDHLIVWKGCSVIYFIVVQTMAFNGTAAWLKVGMCKWCLKLRTVEGLCMSYALTLLTPHSVQEHRSWLCDNHWCLSQSKYTRTNWNKIKSCDFWKFYWSYKYLSRILMIITWQKYFHHVTTEIRIRYVFRMLAN